MLALIRSISRIRFVLESLQFPRNLTKIFNFRYAKCFSTTSQQLYSQTEEVTDLGYRNQYNHEEAIRILDTVNKFSPKELKNYNISQMRLNKLLHHRDIQGNFKSVEELLELEGFGVKVLERFCNSILQSEVRECEHEEEDKAGTEKTVEISYRKKNSFISPALLEAFRPTIKTVVSFQLDLNFFAWSKICYNPEATDIIAGKYYLEEWHCYEVGNLNKKLKLPDLIKLLVHLNDHIPHADVYVIESLPLVHTIRNSQAQIVVNVTKAQFYAMVSAVMAARKPIKMTENGNEELIDNVYFLKTFLPSRFYKYLVGSERIASADVIEHIIEYNLQSKSVIEDPKLSSIDIPFELKEYWMSASSVHKEYLGTSLLVGLTFMKLCIEKCNKSIASMKRVTIK